MSEEFTLKQINNARKLVLEEAGMEGFDQFLETFLEIYDNQKIGGS